MVTVCVLRCVCPATRRDHTDRNEFPKHRHISHYALHTFFGHVYISLCEAVLRHYWFADWFGHQIYYVFLTLDSPPSKPCGSHYLAATCMPHQCASIYQSHVSGRCVPWPSHQWPALATSRNPDPSRTTQVLLTQTLPLLQQICFCAASCNDLLLSCVCFQSVAAEQYHA